MAAEGMDASLLSATLASATLAAPEEGKADHSAQELAEALTSYDRAIALKPNFADAFVRRAAVLLKQRRHAEALASCTKAIALNRDNASAWAHLGRILGEAINLPELVCETQADYIAKAIDLALRPAELARIRRQLADNRLTTPLFDTPEYSRHIEAAYRQMHLRRLDGLPPAYFSLAASAV